MERDSTVFYKSFYEAANMFRDGKKSSEKIRLEFYDALFDYAFVGKEPGAELSRAAGALFALVKPQIEANNKKYLVGMKGGRPRSKPYNTEADGARNKPVVFEDNENLKPNDKMKMNNVNVNEYENDYENVNANKNENAALLGAGEKKIFGKYKNVYLTEYELERLKERLGSECGAAIERFSEGLELKGYKYHSHYLAIIKWAEKDADEKKGRRPTTYDLSDLDRIINDF